MSKTISFANNLPFAKQISKYLRRDYVDKQATLMKQVPFEIQLIIIKYVGWPCDGYIDSRLRNKKYKYMHPPKLLGNFRYNSNNPISENCQKQIFIRLFGGPNRGGLMDAWRQNFFKKYPFCHRLSYSPFIAISKSFRMGEHEEVFAHVIHVGKIMRCKICKKQYEHHDITHILCYDCRAEAPNVYPICKFYSNSEQIQDVFEKRLAAAPISHIEADKNKQPISFIYCPSPIHVPHRFEDMY